MIRRKTRSNALRKEPEPTCADIPCARALRNFTFWSVKDRAVSFVQRGIVAAMQRIRSAHAILSVAPAAACARAATTPPPQLLPPPSVASAVAKEKPKALPVDAIDGAIRDAWKAEGLAPAPRADDATFLRRAYLDIVGTIPPADAVGPFL